MQSLKCTKDRIEKPSPALAPIKIMAQHYCFVAKRLLYLTKKFYFCVYKQVKLWNI